MDGRLRVELVIRFRRERETLIKQKAATSEKGLS